MPEKHIDYRVTEARSKVMEENGNDLGRKGALILIEAAENTWSCADMARTFVMPGAEHHSCVSDVVEHVECSCALYFKQNPDYLLSRLHKYSLWSVGLWKTKGHVVNMCAGIRTPSLHSRRIDLSWRHNRLYSHRIGTFNSSRSDSWSSG